MAAIATLLVAVDPSYVFFSRMGIHVTSVMNVFALGSLLSFLHWQDDGAMRWLALGGCCWAWACGLRCSSCGGLWP